MMPPESIGFVFNKKFGSWNYFYLHVFQDNFYQQGIWEILNNLNYILEFHPNIYQDQE